VQFLSYFLRKRKGLNPKCGFSPLFALDAGRGRRRGVGLDPKRVAGALSPRSRDPERVEGGGAASVGPEAGRRRAVSALA